MVEDSEGDSLFMSSHGLVTGDSVTLTTQSATYGGFSGTNAVSYTHLTLPTNREV